MNTGNNSLDRLFRAAAQTAPMPLSTAPYGMDTRALAAWRSARAGDGGLWDAVLLRGFVAACVIMAVSFVPVLSTPSTTTNPFAETLQLADSTVSTDDTP